MLHHKCSTSIYCRALQTGDAIGAMYSSVGVGLLRLELTAEQRDKVSQLSASYEATFGDAGDAPQPEGNEDAGRHGFALVGGSYIYIYIYITEHVLIASFSSKRFPLFCGVDWWGAPFGPLAGHGNSRPCS